MRANSKYPNECKRRDLPHVFITAKCDEIQNSERGRGAEYVEGEKQNEDFHQEPA